MYQFQNVFALKVLIFFFLILQASGRVLLFCVAGEGADQITAGNVTSWYSFFPQLCCTIEWGLC